jgi:hypothetical protein
MPRGGETAAAAAAVAPTETAATAAEGVPRETSPFEATAAETFAAAAAEGRTAPATLSESGTAAAATTTAAEGGTGATTTAGAATIEAALRTALRAGPGETLGTLSGTTLRAGIPLIAPGRRTRLPPILLPAGLLTPCRAGRPTLRCPFSSTIRGRVAPILRRAAPVVTTAGTTWAARTATAAPVTAGTTRTAAAKGRRTEATRTTPGGATGSLRTAPGGATRTATTSRRSGRVGIAPGAGGRPSSVVSPSVIVGRAAPRAIVAAGAAVPVREPGESPGAVGLGHLRALGIIARRLLGTHGRGEQQDRPATQECPHNATHTFLPCQKNRFPTPSLSLYLLQFTCLVVRNC